jgi:hypothetical protein
MISETDIFHECNEHLKETDKKRDQVIGFYIVLIGLLLSNNEKLGNHPDLILGIFSLLGIFIIAVIIQYRKWHISYVRASQAVTIYSRINNENFQNRINITKSKISAYGYMSKWYNWLNPLRSSEAILFFIIIGASFIPIQLFIIETDITFINLPFKWSIFLNLLTYYAIAIVICFCILRKEIQKDPFENWLLQPIELAHKEQIASEGSSHNQANTADGKSPAAE